MPVRERKKELRETCRALVRGKAGSLSSSKASDRAQENFLKEFPPRAGMTVAVYNAFRGEVGTERIREAFLAAGATLYYPCVEKGTLGFYPHREGDGWVAGQYGISEPFRSPGVPPKTEGFDLVVVPGVAFDRAGRRLGQGLGYYDRFLRGLPEDVLRVGLAYSEQLVQEVPVDVWDVAVHAVVTEEEVLRFSRNGRIPKK